MPLMPKALTWAATSSPASRLSQTKFFSLSATRCCKSAKGMFKTLASAANLTGSWSMSSGLAQMLGTGTLEAKI